MGQGALRKINPRRKNPHFYKVLKQREDWGYPTTVVITGGNQYGKSCFGLKLCEDMDKSFNNDRIFFNISQFNKIFKDIYKTVRAILKQNPHAKNYSFWVLGDEFSRSCSAKDWNTKSAKVVQMVTDAGGILHINLVLTELVFDVIKSIRKRVNYQIEMIKPGMAKIWRNQADRWGTRDWRERMYIMELPMPSEKLWLEYMNRKINKELPDILEEADQLLTSEKKERGPTKTDLILDYVKANPDILKLSQKKIAVKVKEFYKWTTLSQDSVHRALANRPKDQPI
jgi:hypothetical protein